MTILLISLAALCVTTIVLTLLWSSSRKNKLPYQEPEFRQRPFQPLQPRYNAAYGGVRRGSATRMDHNDHTDYTTYHDPGPSILTAALLVDSASSHTHHDSGSSHSYDSGSSHSYDSGSCDSGSSDSGGGDCGGGGD